MNAEATVLKLYPLGENGLIAVWCTEEGLIRTAAKSARKPGSPFAGCLDIFYQCRMQWTQAKKGDLHTLTSADLLSPRLALRKSYLRLSAAGYFARLFLQMLEPDTPIPEFYDLLQRAYTYLENNDPTLRAVLHFEQELARLHGIAHPGIPAHVILKSHFGKLPPQRENCSEAWNKRKLSNMPILLSSSAGDVPRPAQHVLPPGRDAHCSVREIDLSAAFGQNIRHGFTA